MALGAGNVLGQKNLRHERHVIQFHVDVSQVVAHGRIVVEAARGRYHFVDDAIIGLILMNGVL